MQYHVYTCMCDVFIIEVRAFILCVGSEEEGG